MSQNVTVTTTLTRILAERVAGADVLAVHIKNKGAAALNAFRLKGRAGDGGDFGFVDIKTANFTSPDLHCIYASAEPGTLASGAECILYLSGYLQDLELWASVASGTADVVVDAKRMED